MFVGLWKPSKGSESAYRRICDSGRLPGFSLFWCAWQDVRSTTGQAVACRCVDPLWRGCFDVHDGDVCTGTARALVHRRFCTRLRAVQQLRILEWYVAFRCGRINLVSDRDRPLLQVASRILLSSSLKRASGEAGQHPRATERSPNCRTRSSDRRSASTGLAATSALRIPVHLRASGRPVPPPERTSTRTFPHQQGAPPVKGQVVENATIAGLETLIGRI